MAEHGADTGAERGPRDVRRGRPGIAAQRYVPMLLDRITKGELDPSYLVTHRLGLEDGARGYDLFKTKQDGCVRVVFRPGAEHRHGACRPCIWPVAVAAET
jgi:hypothetical protein